MEKLHEELKLSRGLDKEGLACTLGLNKNPTFLFRDILYYSDLSRADLRRDANENKKVFLKNNIECTNTNVDKKIISCWSINDAKNILTQNNYAAVVESKNLLIEKLIYDEIFSQLNVRIKKTVRYRK